MSLSQINPSQLRKSFGASEASNKGRKEGIQHNIGSAYQHMMGSVQNPQDHPANNVSHPSGNRGRMDATVPLNVPQSLPTTSEYADEINY